MQLWFQHFSLQARRAELPSSHPPPPLTIFPFLPHPHPLSWHYIAVLLIPAGLTAPQHWLLFHPTETFRHTDRMRHWLKESLSNTMGFTYLIYLVQRDVVLGIGLHVYVKQSFISTAGLLNWYTLTDILICLILPVLFRHFFWKGNTIHPQCKS